MLLEQTKVTLMTLRNCEDSWKLHTYPSTPAKQFASVPPARLIVSRPVPSHITKPPYWAFLIKIIRLSGERRSCLLWHIVRAGCFLRFYINFYFFLCRWYCAKEGSSHCKLCSEVNVTWALACFYAPVLRDVKDTYNGIFQVKVKLSIVV